MLCHLICVVDLRAFGDVVSFSRFNFVVLVRFVSLGLSPPLLFLLFSFMVMVDRHLLGGTLYRLNSLCLLRFVIVVFFSF